MEAGIYASTHQLITDYAMALFLGGPVLWWQLAEYCISCSIIGGMTADPKVKRLREELYSRHYSP
jgi:hypothetical protein